MRKVGEAGMPDRESVMQALKDSLRNQYCGFIENVGNVYAVSEEIINDTLELLKEQEQRINELEEKLRLMEYGDQGTL